MVRKNKKSSYKYRASKILETDWFNETNKVEKKVLEDQFNKIFIKYLEDMYERSKEAKSEECKKEPPGEFETVHKEYSIKIKRDKVEPIFNSEIPPPTNKVAWVFYLLSANKCEDILANLEDLYERRFLKITNGDKKKADRIFVWQVFWAVIEHHKGKLLAALFSLFGIFGFKGLLKNIKGWFFHKD